MKPEWNFSSKNWKKRTVLRDRSTIDCGPRTMKTLPNYAASFSDHYDNVLLACDELLNKRYFTCSTAWRVIVYVTNVSQVTTTSSTATSVYSVAAVMWTCAVAVITLMLHNWRRISLQLSQSWKHRSSFFRALCVNLYCELSTQSSSLNNYSRNKDFGPMPGVLWST